LTSRKGERTFEFRIFGNETPLEATSAVVYRVLGLGDLLALVLLELKGENDAISRPRKRQWAAIISTIGLSLGAVAVSAGTAGTVNSVGGHIAGGSGHLTISGRVDVDNAATAEFHLVVADHGLKNPSLPPGQIKTGGPGVQVGFLVPDMP
jgi:hypothetical protein